MPMRPGDPAATEEQLDRLVTGVEGILGQDLVGMYQHGSAVLGGLRPDSDIDVIVVASRRAASDEKRELISLLLSISGASTAGRPIELDVVVASEIRPWRYPPTFDLHYSELWRERFEGGDVEPWSDPTNPDLASAITMALIGDAPLVGPPAAEVFDPVPRADYLDAILRDVETVDEYLSWDTRNVVLTLPRIWSAIASDRVDSKESSALWALPRLPADHRIVLERALAAYRGDFADTWDDLREARAYADHVVAEIERARGSGSDS